MKSLLTLIMAGIVFAGSTSILAQMKTPYAGQQHREIKALSSSEIDGLLKGKGLGMAKPAELNKYPGPLHVLEIATRLDLSSEQLKQTERLYAQMKSEAIPLGEKIVSSEKRLDELFSSGGVTDSSLKSVLNDIAKLRGELRFVHLKMHLRQKKIMTPSQIHQYNRLRGYAKHHH